MKEYIEKLLSYFVPSILKIFTKTIRFFYRPKKIRVNKKSFPTVFIVGAPRTGSTILYQSITNQFDVTYIDNITCLFHPLLLLGVKISKLLYSDSAHDTSKSKFGNTTNLGFHAPSECGNFWYRWLPQDKHFIDYGDFDENVVEEIRNEIYSVIIREQKPFVFKNLNAGQRLRLINKVVPNAKIIFIRRKPLDTALSIYKSRLKNDVKDDEWWSIMPPNINELNSLSLYEKIVKQIYFIEKQIMRDKNLFPKENFLTIDYDDFLDNPEESLNIIKKFLGKKIRKRENAKNLSIKKKNHEYDEKIVKLFEKEVEKLDW